MNKLNDLTIEILQKCPNHCMHCSSLASINSTKLIPLDNVIDVALQAYEIGLKRIAISGGEPLYHPNIVEIVQSLNNIGLKVSIYTTGISQDNSRPISFNKWDLFPKDNTKLIFSIQSINSLNHDKISGRNGALKLTIDSLKSSLDKGFYTEVHLVPNKVNLFDIEETVNTLSSWGVNQISFLRLVPQGYAHKNRNGLVFNNEEIKYFTSLIENLSRKDFGNTSMRFGIPFSHNFKKQMKCNAGDNKLIIRYDGKVLPCEAFKDAKFGNFVLGDIYNNKLRDILYKGKNNKELKLIKNKTNSCETCPAQIGYLIA